MSNFPFETIEINAPEEGFPTLKETLVLKVPTYLDYRLARQRYPSPARDSDRLPTYSVEELLVAMCFVGVDGKPFDQNPRDVMDRVKHLSIADRQYLNLLFREAFLLTDDLAKQARAFATQTMFQLPPSLSYTIPRDTMPNKRLSVSFNRPNTGTQFEADRLHKGPEIHGCTLEEFLFACCLSEIDGKPAEKPSDLIATLDSWGTDEVGFAVTVFINMFVLDNSGAEKAKKQGAGLREKRFSKKSATPQRNIAPKATEN
jgi:hypothetical protein